MPHIVLSTFGSYGDVNPYLAIGSALRSRGASVRIVTSAVYRADVERHGLEFAPTRPDVDLEDAGVFEKVLDPRRGADFLIREIIVPALRDAYADLDEACAGADFLLSHVLSLAGPIVAEKRSLPWATAFLQPMALFSAHDMPVIPPLTGLKHLRGLGPRFCAGLMRALFSLSASWGRPVLELRRELGLGPGPDPLFEAYRSPFGNLALFPEAFGAPQPDWPPSTHSCGFAFLDEDTGGAALAPEADEFLRSGPPPMVFTLGSSAVKIAAELIGQGRAVAERLGARALIVAGDASPEITGEGRSKNLLTVPSIPYHEVFPLARLIVHSGGIGTTAHALRAGVPQVIIPFSYDQFDNATRVQKLGCGLDAGSRRVGVARLAGLVRRAFEEPRFAETAARMAPRIGVDGAERAASQVLAWCSASASGTSNSRSRTEHNGRHHDDPGGMHR